MDVKGKLAELYLYRRLEALASEGSISDLEWLDLDGAPDFRLIYQGRRLKVECKNVRGKQAVYRLGPHKGLFKVEIQKTRTGIDPKTGKNTRGYPVDHFDVLAACLFNQTGRWEYLFAASRRLNRRGDDPGLLVC